MEIPARTVPLKGGRQAVLRSPAPEDGAEMLAFLKRCYGETDFLLCYPEEFTQSVEQEAAFLEGILADPDTVMISCVLDGEIVGNCQISFQRQMKIRHRASVAVAVLEKCWGLGIGTAMFNLMIELARERQVLQLELDVFEGNGRARGLYEKMGFHVVGEKPNAVRRKDGTMLKEYSMVRELS